MIIRVCACLPVSRLLPLKNACSPAKTTPARRDYPGMLLLGRPSIYLPCSACCSDDLPGALRWLPGRDLWPRPRSGRWRFLYLCLPLLFSNFLFCRFGLFARIHGPPFRKVKTFPDYFRAAMWARCLPVINGPVTFVTYIPPRTAAAFQFRRCRYLFFFRGFRPPMNEIQTNGCNTS